MLRRSSRTKKAKEDDQNELEQKTSIKKRTPKEKKSSPELQSSKQDKYSADTKKQSSLQESRNNSKIKRKASNQCVSNGDHLLSTVKKQDLEIDDETAISIPKKRMTKGKRDQKNIKEASVVINIKEESKAKKTKRQRSIRPLKNVQITDDISDIGDSKVMKAEYNPDLAIKKEIGDTIGMKFVGAHMSIAGGLENAVFDAVKIGAKSFGMFLKSQRQWASKPLEESAAEKFKDSCKKTGFPSHLILPHGSYLLNCGSPNQETLAKSRSALIDELQRCEKLGLVLFNFHPGSTCGEITVDECLDRIAESINEAHSKTKYVITVIENMSCQGNTVGGKFEELRGIIDRVHDKSRMGVCLDTCHAFAAGYDLSSEKGFHKMMEDFEKQVGFEYLKAVHLNDSKGKVGCHLDRHENIGKGFIGLEGFRRIMEDPHFNDMPMVLETPYISDAGYGEEIQLLNSLTT